MSIYIFRYKSVQNNLNKVIWITQPFKFDVGKSPMDVYMDNFNFIIHNVNVKTTSYDEFRNYVKDFAKKHASRLSNPLTWGNLVFSVRDDGFCENFEA